MKFWMQVTSDSHTGSWLGTKATLLLFLSKAWCLHDKHVSWEDNEDHLKSCISQFWGRQLMFASSERITPALSQRARRRFRFVRLLNFSENQNQRDRNVFYVNWWKWFHFESAMAFGTVNAYSLSPFSSFVVEPVPGHFRENLWPVHFSRPSQIQVDGLAGAGKSFVNNNINWSGEIVFL